MKDDEAALEYHARGRPGKIEVIATKPLSDQRDLSLAYTPGVASACRAIQKNPADAYRYTAKGNLVAVVSNGSAVLGLGNIGPLAGKPVMEGKANLFKKFADIDVFDVELDAPTADEMVEAIKAMAPTFGGINLEDVRSPECFEVEQRLQAELDIPVFHDDQHGTAIISAAALLNAAELTGRDLSAMRVVFSGAGAAALACAEHYVALGLQRENILMFDVNGLLHDGRADLFPQQQAFATKRRFASMAEALDGADAFVGLSVGNVLTGEMLQRMSARPIVFAMANPDPEIPFAQAREARPDAILATGRSDNPNQVNNVLGFPFVFRGALDCRARKFTQEMKNAATHALADLAKQNVPDNVLRAYGLENLRFGPDYIIPKPFDPRALVWVAPAVAEAAQACGVARQPIDDLEAYREQLHSLVVRARGILYPLVARARSSRQQRIVFPDGTSPGVLRAAQILRDEGICKPLLLGPRDKIEARAELAGVKLHDLEILETPTGPRFDELANRLWKLRARKGMTLPAARNLVRDPTWHGGMLLHEGSADGMVGGLGRAYKLTLGPLLRVVGTESPDATVSGVYAMLFRERQIFLGDCTVNVEPTSRQLADIALNTARVAETFGAVPRVAMLSYSDFGEHYSDPQVRTVREAIQIVRERRPDLEIDGEMQADTALVWEKIQTNFPFAELSGPANVLIFPALTSGNIAYKMLTALTDAEALGPLLVGLAKPVNVMPVHASVSEIVHVATYTVTQALDGNSR